MKYGVVRVRARDIRLVLPQIPIQSLLSFQHYITQNHLKEIQPMNKLLLSDPVDPDLVPWDTIIERFKEFLHLVSTIYSNIIHQLQNLFSSSGNFLSSDALFIAIVVVLVVYLCAYGCFRAAARGPRMNGYDPEMDGPVYRVKRGTGLFSFHPNKVVV